MKLIRQKKKESGLVQEIKKRFLNNRWIQNRQRIKNKIKKNCK